MKCMKIIFAAALITFCYISLGYSLKCFVCNSKESCKKPALYECNQKLANDTRLYLNNYHNGVQLNVTSNKYDCFAETLIYPNGSGETFFKSCIYANISGCKFSTKFPTANRTCRQCNNKDGCNPAGRATIDAKAAFIVAAILRYKWH